MTKLAALISASALLGFAIFAIAPVNAAVAPCPVPEAFPNPNNLITVYEVNFQTTFSSTGAAQSTCTIIARQYVSALDGPTFYGETSQSCPQVASVALLLAITCASASAHVSWLSDSTCSIGPQTTYDAYCLGIDHSGGGSGNGGGGGTLSSDVGGSHPLFWDINQNSDSYSFPQHQAVHRASREPTGCHNVESNVHGPITPVADVIAKGCWVLK